MASGKARESNLTVGGLKGEIASCKTASFLNMYDLFTRRLSVTAHQGAEVVGSASQLSVNQGS